MQHEKKSTLETTIQHICKTTIILELKHYEKNGQEESSFTPSRLAIGICLPGVKVEKIIKKKLKNLKTSYIDSFFVANPFNDL